MPAQFWLREQVYARRVNDGVILLDLVQDRYFGIGEEDSQALASLVEGWPATPPLSGTHRLEDLPVAANVLLEKGLLTTNRSQKRVPAPQCLPHDATLSIADCEREHPSMNALHIARFVAALAQATWQLRFRSLQFAVLRTADRKTRLGRRTSFDLQHATDLIAIFRRIRMFFFSADGKCLFDALVLINFLARYGMFPMWVIGVRSGPFAAHSWVQQDNLLLGSTPEEVGGFQPILAV